MTDAAEPSAEHLASSTNPLWRGDNFVVRELDDYDRMIERLLQDQPRAA